MKAVYLGCIGDCLGGGSFGTGRILCSLCGQSVVTVAWPVAGDRGSS
jgi:hypothetical protein